MILAVLFSIILVGRKMYLYGYTNPNIQTWRPKHVRNDTYLIFFIFSGRKMFQWTLLELACSVFLNELSDGSFNTMTGGPYIYIYTKAKSQIKI